MGIKRKIQKDIQQRKIEVVFTNERLITPGGLSIVGGLLKTGVEAVEEMRNDPDFFKARMA